jgi:hypothetical protein
MAPLSSLPAPNLSDDPYLALLGPVPAGAPVAYRMRFALNAAVLAPSIHNTQPWRFRLHDGVDPYVDLLMDTSRGLPALDPANRQLVISCGAALAAYQVGLRGCGLTANIGPPLSGDEPGLVARIHVSERGEADQSAREMWRWLRERRSYRGPMTDKPIDAQLQTALAGAAAPALLHFVPEDTWRSVEHLITDATLELDESAAINEESKTWTRGTERTRDGVPATNWQRTSTQTAGAPVVQRDFAQGRPLPGGPPRTAVEADPQLAVLLTARDTPRDWLEAGQSLLRVALLVQSAGAALGYVNQPTEVPGLREKLAAALQPLPAEFTVPQLVLRLGYAAHAQPPATPRRPAYEVTS